MLNELKANLESIYQEKTTKIIPENIRMGVTIFGVEGELASMPYIEDTVVDNIVFSNPTGSTYTFTLNSGGYYESNNKGKDSTYAMGRFTFRVIKQAPISVTVINYAENNYDYGIIGQIDQTLAANTSVDSGAISLKGKSQAAPQEIDLGIATAGTHYIDFKFRKDGSSSSNNDSLQIKLNTGSKIYINYPIYNSEEELLADTAQPDETYAVVVNNTMQVVSMWQYANSVWTQKQIINRNAKWYETTNEFSNDTLNRLNASKDNPYYGIIGKQNALTQYVPNNNFTTNNVYIKKSVTFNTAITETYSFEGYSMGYWEQGATVLKNLELTPTQFTVIRESVSSSNVFDDETQTNRSGVYRYKMIFTTSDSLTYTFSTATKYFHFYNTMIDNVEYPEKDLPEEADTVEEQIIDDITYLYINKCIVGYNYDGVIVPIPIREFIYGTANTLESIVVSTASNSYSTYDDDLYCEDEKMVDCKVYASGSVHNGTLLNPLSGSDDMMGKYISSPSTKLEIYKRLQDLLTTSSLYDNVEFETGGRMDITNWHYDTIPEFYISEQVESLSIGGNNLVEVPNLDYSHIKTLSIETGNTTSLSNIDISNVEELRLNVTGSLDISNQDLSGATRLDIYGAENTNITGLDSANISNLENLDLEYLTNGISLANINLPKLESLAIRQCTITSFENFGTPVLKSLDISKSSDEISISIDDLDFSSLESLRLYGISISSLEVPSTMTSLYISGGTTDIALTGDLSNITTIGINNNSAITTLGNLVTPSLTDMHSEQWEYGPYASTGFKNLTNLVTVEGIDTSKVTSISYAFYNDSKLVNIPVFNLGSMTSSFYGVFSGCTSLSDESLNNILASILTLPSSYSSGKSLSSQFGLNSTQVTKAKTLSNWTSVSALGWT